MTPALRDLHKLAFIQMCLRIARETGLSSAELVDCAITPKTELETMGEWE